MSGAKSGSIPVLPLAVPILVAGGVVLGAAHVATGVVRLARETYKKIAQAADEAAAKELDRIRASIREAVRVTGDTGVATLVAKDNYERTVGALLATERKTIEESDAVLRYLQAQHESRVNTEKELGLRPELSDKIAREMEEHRRCREAAERDRREKEMALRKALAGKVERAVTERLSDIAVMLLALEPCYPDLVRAVREKLPKVRREVAAYDRFVRIHGIEKRYRMICDEKSQNIASRLVGVRLRYESDPWMSRLTPEDRSAFREAFNVAVEMLEKGRGRLEDAEKLEELLVAHRERAVEIDQNVRFEEAVEKVRKGLFARGYQRIDTSRGATVLTLRGIRANGQSVTISVSLPKADDAQPALRIEVGEAGYDSPDQWREEGQNITREFQSLGMVLDFSEETTHFRGGLVENAATLLKRRYEEKHPNSTVSITLEKDNRVVVNGRRLHWAPGSTVSDLIAQLDAREKTGPTKGRERVKERG